MTCAAYKLNQQGDNIQPSWTPSLILNQFIFPCLPLTVAFWTAYSFLRRQVRLFWYSHIHKNFPSCWDPQFGEVNGADVFLEFPYFLYVPATVGNLISDSFAFSKSNFYIWKFSVHVLLKCSLKDFEHYLDNMWKEHSCTVVWTFFGIAFLWDLNENCSISVLVSLLSFPNLLVYWVQHFPSIIF